MTSRPDITVVGAGPAGLATAIALRLAGHRVAVLDRRKPPIDKACGEGLMPEALDHLEALGVELRAGRAFAGIRYLQEDCEVEGAFPGRPGVGIRRLALHAALEQRADALDIDVHWNSLATLRPEAGRFGLEVDGAPWPTHWIVAADGMRSRLREAAGLSAPARETDPRFGVRRHYRREPWADVVEVYWSEQGEAYVTPVADDEIGVAILWRPGALERGDAAQPFEQLMRAFPRLGERLRGGTPCSKVRGLGPLRQRTRGVRRHNLALVGDASGYLDAITGEGMSRGFAHARLLAASIENGMRGYAKAHRRHDRLPAVMTHMALALSRHPRVRGRILRLLARQPDLFQRMLDVHVRARHPLALARVVTGLAAASWRHDGKPVALRSGAAS